MYLIWYYVTVAVLTTFMAIIWKPDDMFNVFFKTAFFVIGMWSIINLGMVLGYIVKGPV